MGRVQASDDLTVLPVPDAIVVCRIGSCRYQMRVPLRLRMEMIKSDFAMYQIKCNPDMSVVWAHLENNHQHTYEQRRREWQEETRGWVGL